MVTVAPTLDHVGDMALAALMSLHGYERDVVFDAVASVASLHHIVNVEYDRKGHQVSIWTGPEDEVVVDLTEFTRLDAVKRGKKKHRNLGARRRRRAHQDTIEMDAELSEYEIERNAYAATEVVREVRELENSYNKLLMDRHNAGYQRDDAEYRRAISECGDDLAAARGSARSRLYKLGLEKAEIDLLLTPFPYDRD